MKKKVITFCLLWLLTGCATTPYQPMGFAGGYEDKYLGEGIYLITVKVRVNTGGDIAYEYFHRRASEIVKENGYKKYEVLELVASHQNPKFTISFNKEKSKYKETPKIPILYGRIKCYRD